MQTLYEYITDGEIQKYWGMTDYYTCQMVAQHTNQVFTEQLTEEQLPLCLRLEEATLYSAQAWKPCSWPP